jgi:hypothetical protein
MIFQIFHILHLSDHPAKGIPIIFSPLIFSFVDRVRTADSGHRPLSVVIKEMEDMEDLAKGQKIRQISGSTIIDS